MFPRWTHLPLTLLATSLASISTLPLCTAQTTAAAGAAVTGAWGKVIEFPLIPVAAALLPDGKLLIWSSVQDDDYGRPYNAPVIGETQTVVFDATTLAMEPMSVTNTEHDMFCPGISLLPSGDIVVSGGSSAERTSIYKPVTGTWVSGPDMNVARGYQSSTTLSTGEIFTLGGSWSGEKDGPRPGEVYSVAANGVGAWRLLDNIEATVMETGDKEGSYRSDNHAWFFGWSGGFVFHAGPSTQMLWFDTAGSGMTYGAGTRPGLDSMCGNAVMYDTGKILTVGGGVDYAGATGNAGAIIITINGNKVTTEESGEMHTARTFPNAVVLADGQVVVTGGMKKAILFDDTDAFLEAEIWSPLTGEWTVLAAMSVPRTYHSISILLLDGRIFVGGGGLCGNCNKKDATLINHLDGQIFTPPNLYAPDGTLAERPVITVDKTEVTPGASLVLTAEQPLQTIAILRSGSVTHSTNSDQRRLELCGPLTTPCPANTLKYGLTIPADPGIALPGYWMVVGVDAAGVPSIGHIFLITL